MPIYGFEDAWPRLAADAFIAENATVIGDVEIGERSSIWWGSVIRGDVSAIRIGKRTNIQDNSVIHVTGGKTTTTVGDDVTVGHRVILHGCTVEDGALIGMGSIVLDRAIVGKGTLLGAGSLVTEGTVLPPGVLALGSPARVRRPLTDEEKANLRFSSDHYADLAVIYARRYGFGQGRR